jgi:polyisoprenoid-binding protein YceI
MAIATPALEGMYELDRTHSTVQFAVSHVGVSTFRGSFADVEASFVAEGDVAFLAANAVVDSISIGEPPEFREHVVRGRDFFAADEHPQISFHSTEIDIAHDGTSTVDGVLAIRGVERPVRAVGSLRAPTEDPFGNTRIGFAIEAVIDRRNWNMDWQMPLPAGGDALGWEVEITAQLEFTKRR